MNIFILKKLRKLFKSLGKYEYKILDKITLLEILSTKKKYWLYPIIFFFILFAVLTYFFQGSSVPPWIYSIF